MKLPFISILIIALIPFAPTLPATANGGNNTLSGAPVLQVRGYGLRGNRRLRSAIEMLDTGEEKDYYDAAFIEDAAFIMFSMMNQDGYLDPAIRLQLGLADGSQAEFLWRTGAEVMLPRPTQAESVRFNLEPGVLFYYEEVDFTGLTLLGRREAESYFVPADFLVPLKSARVFTPGKLDESINNLRDVLIEKGYKNATVTAEEVAMDRETGAVRVGIEVGEGQKHRIRRLERKIYYPDREEADRELHDDIAVPYTRRWLQDATVELRNRFLRRGYPEVAVKAETEMVDGDDGEVLVDLIFRVRTGPKVYLDGVVFHGADKTRESVLKRRVRIEVGEELDRLAMEDARYRLARLGVFDSVELDYEEVAPDRRRAIFTLEEGEEIEASLMLGYGSYELLRGGIELAQYNVFGRAHRSRLKLVQSFKSSSVDYTYTMPEILRRDIDAFLNVSALRRREIDFLRREYGGSAGLLSYFPPIDSSLSLRYRYRLLESRRFDAAEQYGMERALVGSVAFDIDHDQRDNPLFPRSGYRLNSTFEVASQALLGEANYQQLELGASWHRGVGRGLYFSLGLKHALTNTPGRVQNHLPFGKRFFPGGDTSVRGYMSGEASPKDADGKLIGAETYTLLNIEIEQVITPSWSLVMFTDGLAMAGRLSSYPYDETLYSVGGGVRYSTFMGPLRAEYGHNPSPRSGDPSGTFHVSLGFPF